MSDAKDRARDALAALVAEFAELDRDALTRDESEATARSWVEKLLSVFGWNAADPRQVRQEYTIRGREARRLRLEGTTHRRPDYALKVGGERILYIDAKRLDVSIEDDDRVSYQVRCYGWSAGFAVSYACDFQEFAIWDCRHKPDAGDDARVARILCLRSTQYLEHFDVLWDYLSRDAIETGSLQRRHPPDQRSRGTEPLDVVFEAKLSEWRVELAKSILRYGGTRDADIVSGAAQRILDRIVFLRICEEIGLEEYGELNAMASDEDGFWPLFMDAHEKHRDLEINVGLQTLYGKLYQFAPREVTVRSVRGVNGLGNEVSLERKALRPLCRNRGFYPFRTDNADAWVIFPYDVVGNQATEILWPSFKQRFPKTAAYLVENRGKLKKAVEVPEGRNRWHLYTRPQNLVAQARPKVLFPSTIEDTVAAVDLGGELYQDNVRVNSLTVGTGGLDLHAVGAVMNSSLFSALARVKAGLSDAGWRQLNRQFAELVPFPYAALKTGLVAKQLSRLAGLIAGQQDQLRQAEGEGQRQAVRATLSSLWTDLDEAVEALYELTPEERQVVARYPRKVDRVELPLRSAEPEEEDDER